MDLPSFIINNFQAIKSNPSPFIILTFLISGLSWLVFTIMHKERIALLQERLASKDEQIKYYKELYEANQEVTMSEPGQSVVLGKTSNLRDDIFSEINYLQQNAGKALSVQLFERLQPKHDFLVILSELFDMSKNNELIWLEAPNPPEALSEIKITKPK